MSYSRNNRVEHGDVVWAAVMWTTLTGAVWMKLGPVYGVAMSVLGVFFIGLAHRGQQITAEHDAKQPEVGGWAK